MWRADYELLTEGYRLRGESREDLLELDINMGALVRGNVNRALFVRDTLSVLFSTKEESGYTK